MACAGGCATIVAGGPDDIPITTYPAGAYVYVDGKVVPHALIQERFQRFPKASFVYALSL